MGYRLMMQIPFIHHDSHGDRMVAKRVPSGLKTGDLVTKKGWKNHLITAVFWTARGDLIELEGTGSRLHKGEEFTLVEEGALHHD